MQRISPSPNKSLGASRACVPPSTLFDQATVRGAILAAALLALALASWPAQAHQTTFSIAGGPIRVVMLDSGKPAMPKLMQLVDARLDPSDSKFVLRQMATERMDAAFPPELAAAGPVARQLASAWPDHLSLAILAVEQDFQGGAGEPPATSAVFVTDEKAFWVLRSGAVVEAPLAFGLVDGQAWAHVRLVRWAEPDRREWRTVVLFTDGPDGNVVWGMQATEDGELLGDAHSSFSRLFNSPGGGFTADAVFAALERQPKPGDDYFPAAMRATLSRRLTLAVLDPSRSTRGFQPGSLARMARELTLDEKPLRPEQLKLEAVSCTAFFMAAN
jgi:hypothetical protein